MLRGAGTTAPQKAKPSITANAMPIEMDKMVVSAAKYHWRHAKSEHFEILSCCTDDNFVARIIQFAEQAIKPFERNLPIYRPNRELPAKLIFIENNGIERFFTGIGITRDTAPDKTAALNKIFNERVAPKFFAGTNIRLENPFLQEPIQSHSAFNAEQMMIVCTITRQYMDETRIPIEKKVMAYGFDLATTYLRECLNGAKINPKSVLLNPFSNMRADSPSSDWLAVNRRNITLYRYDQSMDVINVIEGARDELNKKLFSANKEIERLRQLQQKLFNDLSQKVYVQAKIATLEYQEVGNNCFTKPLLSLRDVFETWELTHREIMDWEPLSDHSIDAQQKYISFRRQAADFAYYCAFGPNPKTRMAFINLIKSREKRPITEEIFKEYFEKSYDEFSTEIYDFFRKISRGTEYQDSAWGAPEMVISQFTAKEVPPRVAWTDATRSQSSRIISDWFFINNQPDIAQETLNLAKNDVPKMLDDAEFCAALGLSELQCEDKDAALPLLETAANARIQRPQIYRSLSQLRFENILAAKGRNYKLSTEETDAVITPLYEAMKLSPSNRQTYWQLIKVMQHLEKPLAKDLLETLVNNCCAQFPDNFELLDQLVPILLKNGSQGEVDRLLDATAKCILTPAEQQRLERLKTFKK